jgi:hypothetical protein
MRIIAVDWSGDRQNARRNLWLAEVRHGRLQRLEAGRGREQVCEHLIELAAADANLVVGFDFAFSAPAWFLRANSLASAPQLWALARGEGERWLAECRPPFWGRGRVKRPVLEAHLRLTDLGVNVGGIVPKSVFQIGGAGAVGTGSVRGWPLLLRLREAGFRVWPFEAGPGPLALEIYPRLLMGPVVKSRAEARRAYLAAHFPGLPHQWIEVAAGSEDAFDAAASALVMARHVEKFGSLSPTTDAQTLLEGLIWDPMRH